MKNGHFYVQYLILGPRGHIVNSVGGGQVGPRTLMAYEEWSFLWVQSGPRTT